MTNFPREQFEQLGKPDEAQVLLIGALGMVVLLLAAGLAADVGYLIYQKHQMQKAADAGAVGAGMALSIYGSGASQITTAGRADSAANGFTNDPTGSGITVAVNNPPVDGPYSTVSNNQDYVEVTVSQPQPTFFMKVGGFFSVPVAARAVTGLRGASGCIYVLDPTDQDSYLESGGSVVTSNCGIFVDSNNTTKAFDDSGNSCTDATTIQVVGGQNGWQECPGTTSPAPVTGIKPFADPLANREQPAIPSCPSFPGTTVKNASVSHGTFCGGLTLEGNVTMGSGLYIVVGGGFTIQGGATVSGTGVTVFNTAPSTNQGLYRGVTISGTSNVTLSAPTSGATEGILFWEDRTIPWNSIGSSQKSQISGGSSTTLVGALYFPTNYLAYTGGSGAAANIDIVAYQLQITGTSTIDDSASNGAPAINTAALVQ